MEELIKPNQKQQQPDHIGQAKALMARTPQKRPVESHAINQPINIEVPIRPIEVGVEIQPPAKQALREYLIMTKAKLLHGQAQQYELQQLVHPAKMPITVVPERHLTLEAQLKTAHIHADLALRPPAKQTLREDLIKSKGKHSKKTAT